MTAARRLVPTPRHAQPCLAVALFVHAIGLGLPGCASTTGSAAARGASPEATARIAADVDPNRAYRSLDEIAGNMAKPQRPADIGPLSERAAGQLAKARSLIAERRFTEASLALERALRFEPDHPAVHASLAALHWASGNVERARTHAERAVERDPDLAEAQFILGRIAVSRGDFDVAISAFYLASLCSDATTSGSLVKQIHYYMGDALANAGYLQAATEQYAAFLAEVDASDADSEGVDDEALLRSGRLSARMAMASLLERLGRPGEAADVLAPAVRESPTDLNVALRQIRLLMEADRFDEALAAANVQGSDDAVLDLIAELYRRTGHPERMIDELGKQVRDHPGDSRLTIRLVDALDAAGRSEEAASTLRSFLDRESGAHAVRLRLVARLVTVGRWSAAVDAAAVGVAMPNAPLADYEESLAVIASDPVAVTTLLDDSLQADEGNGAQLYLLATLANTSGQPDRAKHLLERAVELSPDFVPARAALAGAYIDAFRYDDAIRVASRGVDGVPDDARLAFLLGRAYERLDETDRAELYLRAVTQADRANVEAMFELAKVYLQSRQTNMAQRQLTVLLEQEPGYDAARELLAVMYMREGKPDEAFAQVREMERVTGSPLVKARCATLLDPELRSNADARRAALLSAMETNGGDAATWIALAETHEEDEAGPRRAAYLRALAFDPNIEETLLGLTDAEQRLLNYEAATENLERLVQIRPNRDTWRLALLDAYSVLGRDEAILALTAKQEPKPGIDAARRRDFRSRTIKAMRRLGRGDELLAMLQGWASAEPDNPMWSLWLADEYVERGQAERAVDIYLKQCALHPQDWGAVASLADALVKAGRYDRAAQYVLDRLGDDPDSDQGSWMLAGVLSDSDQFAGFAELTWNRLQRTRNREAFQDLLIDRYRSSGRVHDSIELVESLMDEVVSTMQRIGRARRGGVDMPTDDDVALQPNEPFSPESLIRRLAGLRIQLGLSLIADKQYREAEDQISEWLEPAQDPNERGRLLWLLAAAQRGRGDEDLANATLRRALLLQPDNVSLNNDVAYALVDRGVELEEAERMIRIAVWRAPEQPAYLDTYGWLLYKKGEFAEAERWLLRALQNQHKPDAVILDHLGDTVWRAGDHDRAIEYWTRAMERLQALGDEGPRNADERRVRDETGRKIDAARSGGEPALAPIAEPTAPLEEGASEADGAKGTRL